MLNNTVLQVAAQYAYDQYLSKPYINLDKDESRREYLRETYGLEDTDLRHAHMDEKYQDINRPNHGLAHTLRVAAMVEGVAHALGAENDNEKFNAQEIQALQLCAIFSVVGRDNDGGFSDNQKLYLAFRGESKKRFLEYMDAQKAVNGEYPLGLSNEQVNMYAEVVLKMGDPNSKSKYNKALDIAHTLDLPRCYGSFKMSGIKKTLENELGKESVEKLFAWSDSLAEATGGRKLGVSKYDDDKFIPASRNVQLCIAAINIAAINKAKPPTFLETLNQVIFKAINTAIFWPVRSVLEAVGVKINSKLGVPFWREAAAREAEVKAAAEQAKEAAAKQEASTKVMSSENLPSFKPAAAREAAAVDASKLAAADISAQSRDLAKFKTAKQPAVVTGAATQKLPAKPADSVPAKSAEPAKQAWKNKEDEVKRRDFARAPVAPVVPASQKGTTMRTYDEMRQARSEKKTTSSLTEEIKSSEKPFHDTKKNKL